MSDKNTRLGYPDLDCPDDVFEALLGYGMFPNLLPPCFSSKSLFQYANKNFLKNKKKYERGFIEYRASRNTSVPRQYGIPHPKTYWKLCLIIKEHWSEINSHIGRPEKFNYCHVKKLKNRKYIFEMNYNSADRFEEVEKILDFTLGSKYYVRADIAQCFASIYSHSISWAVKGKADSKTKKERDNKKSWVGQLDQAVRNVKDGETNGLLVGPHASNIISEIILSQIDLELQEKKFCRVIRHIDDYQYFATDEKDAKNFIRVLGVILKKYELVLNEKKTQIVRMEEWSNYHWKHELGQHGLMLKENNTLNYSNIDSFIELALKITLSNNDAAPLKYAIKVVSRKALEPRAQRLYVKKILQLSILYPYLLPLMEEKIFCFKGSDFQSQLGGYLYDLLKVGMESGGADSIIFCFYFAMKYEVKIREAEKYVDKIIELNDCIAMLMAFKYCEKFSLCEAVLRIKEKASSLNNEDERVQDQFWLFIYEVLESDVINDEFLKNIKKTKKVNFINVMDDVK